MVDTVRSISTLLAALVDNTSGAITPQVIRDVVVSLEPAIGGCYITSTAATTFSDSVTPVKIAGTTTAIGGLHNFTSLVTNRLVYTGAAQATVLCIVSLSMTAAGNNKIIELSVAKNGSVVADSLMQRKIGTGTDVGHITLIGMAQLVENDYIEPFILNTTDTVSATATHLNFSAIGIVT